MTEALVPTTAAIPQAKMRIWRALLRKPTSMFALLVLVLVSAIAVLAPWISPHDPTLVSIDDVLLAPSRTHLLGTDHAGRDMLSRVLSASLLSVGSGLIALATSVGLGVALGLVAGYYGGWFDAVSNWANSAVMALPAIVVLVAARAAFGPNLLPLMILLGIFISPVFFRLVYNAVRSVRKELYVDAARVAGLSDTRIIGRHVLTAVRAPVIVQTALVAGMSVAILAGVEFLGLGDPDSPSWGGLLNSGFQQTFNAPWLTIGPAVALGLTCMAFVLLGNALRDELERSSSPRRHRRGGAAAAAAAAVGASPVVGGPATDTGAVSHMGAERPGAGADALLAVRDLRVAYDQPDGSVVEIVHGVSLDLRRGEIHGLIGESGSGKTQTAFAVLGLLGRGGRITSGEISFDGTRLEDADERTYSTIRGRRIGYIPQEPMSNLDPSFTVGSQLVHPLVKRKGMSKMEAREHALALLDRVGIASPSRTFASYPFEISGGMAQRVLIAGAVSMDPEILIADEPTTALDVTVQAEVLDLLRDLQEERNLSMLLVTHNVGVVADLCNWVTVMRQGTFVETGPVRSVLRTPRHPYTVSLLDALLDNAPPRSRTPVHGEGTPQ